MAIEKKAGQRKGIGDVICRRRFAAVVQKCRQPHQLVAVGLTACA